MEKTAHLKVGQGSLPERIPLQYYVSARGRPRTGFFGSAGECARWCLSFGGAHYSITPRTKAGIGVAGPWCFKTTGLAASQWLRRQTVPGTNEDEALAALGHLLLARRGQKTPFEMRLAQCALPLLIDADQAAFLYYRFVSPGGASRELVNAWLAKPKHESAVLVAMLEHLGADPQFKLSAEQVSIIGFEILF